MKPFLFSPWQFSLVSNHLRESEWLFLYLLLFYLGLLLPTLMHEASKKPSFGQWLIEEIGLTKASASDVKSRLNRVRKLTFEDQIDESSLDKLRRPEEYQALNAPLQGQLKRAINLWLQYNK